MLRAELFCLWAAILSECLFKVKWFSFSCSLTRSLILSLPYSLSDSASLSVSFLLTHTPFLCITHSLFYSLPLFLSFLLSLLLSLPLTHSLASSPLPPLFPLTHSLPCLSTFYACSYTLTHFPHFLHLPVCLLPTVLLSFFCSLSFALLLSLSFSCSLSLLIPMVISFHSNNWLIKNNMWAWKEKEIKSRWDTVQLTAFCRQGERERERFVLWETE